MDVTFRTTKLRDICNSEKELFREFGKDIARKIMLPLNELRNAENLSQIPPVPPPRCHELVGDRKGQFAVDLKHPHRLVFTIANDPILLKSDSGIDLTKVTKIKILEVADYHG